MEKYRLKIKYPSLFQEHKIGDIVYYNFLTKNYVKAEAPHYSVSAYDVENFPDCWELIEEKKPLFITEDGVEIMDEMQSVITIDSDINVDYTRYQWANKTHLIFGSKEGADEYIWRNKPVFSYEDFIRWGNVPYERVIKELAMERIK